MILNNSRYFCLIIHLYIRNIKEKGYSEIIIIIFSFKIHKCTIKVSHRPLPPTLQHPDCLSKFWFGVLLKSWNNSWICACIIVKRIVFKNLFVFMQTISHSCDSIVNTWTLQSGSRLKD